MVNCIIIEECNKCTDFNGDEFMKNIPKNLSIDDNLLNEFAPKIVEGTKRLKAWVEST